MKQQVIFNWSGGKDSALCLYKLRQQPEYEVMCLLTSISESYQRISMHGVRVELLEKQVAAIGLPLLKMLVPETPTMEVYEQTMAKALHELKQQGATVAAFGDIFLEDLRQYREDKLTQVGLTGLFPLWKLPTKQLMHEFIDLGFKTITTCVNEKYLDKSFVGRVIDHDFLKDLPKDVDPCGENGEFHTFVYDGPLFKQPINFVQGEIVYRTYTPAKQDNNNSYDCSPTDNPINTGFWYADLLPA
ncbi:MAG: diphthine--ammonia ligase [Bacteroidetes bacterium]|nr:MAG: diphthine--ammonia ligase [Bacteroidota bacterium]